MTVHLEASVEVGVPADRAFAALTDLASQDRWMLATRLYPLAGPAALPAVGSGLAALTGIGDVGFLDTMEVIEYEPGQCWKVRHTGTVIRGTGTFSVAPTATGSCRVTWAEDLDLPFGAVGRLGWPLARPVARAGLRISLRRLADGLRTGSLPVTASPGEHNDDVR